MIFIIQFSWGEAGHVSGVWVWCLWWNLIKFYALVPPTLDFFADFYWDILGNWHDMLSYCSSEEKGRKIALLGCYLGKNWASMGHAQNETLIFFRKWQKEIISFQELFILSEYKFWLSYEWFSDLCDILLLKLATSGLEQSSIPSFIYKWYYSK